MEQRRQQRRNSGQVMHLILLALFLFLSISLLVRACTGSDSGANQGGDGLLPPSSDQTGMLPEIPPSTPYVTATASIGITGDVLAHGPVIQSALTEDGGYDFSKSFTYIANSYDAYDFMIANLEVTLGGTAAGEYRGYPTFNCPDEMIDALQGAGVDMLLTANNHSYDTGHNGFIRTQEVLQDKGMHYLGSRLSTDTANYLVQDINGIKVGMMCYTYETGDTEDGEKTINGIPVAKEDTDLLNSFNYRQMDQFYTEVKNTTAAMEEQGADFVMIFIHWGNEYELTPSNTQKKIAQNLCELGIDIIVGGHPHVVQPMQVLTSEAGEKTYCIYSVGNAISNQRRYEINLAPNGHSEDGLIFGVKFERWSDGTVKISDMNVTPLWVSLDNIDGKSQYTIIPVDVTYNFYPALSTFAESVNNVIDPARPDSNIVAFVPTDASQIPLSYARTMDRIVAGLNECRQSLGLKPVSNASGN